MRDLAKLTTRAMGVSALLAVNLLSGLLERNAEAQFPGWKARLRLPAGIVPRSVTPIGNDHVVVSIVGDGLQYVFRFAGATIAQVGSPFNAPGHDQFGDAAFTPSFGGRLLTGHRWGGLNLIDVSTPSALTMPACPGSAVSTKYHHEGLKTWDSTSGSFVAYSEHNVSNRGGGIILYQNSGCDLTEVGRFIKVGHDGNALEISSNGETIWQLGHHANDWTQGHVMAYKTLGMTQVLPTTLAALPRSYGYGSQDLEKNGSETRLLAALGNDGLRDIRLSGAPIVDLVKPSPLVFMDGVSFLPSTNVALAWGTIATSPASDWLSFWGVPAIGPSGLVPPFVWNVSPLQTLDLKFPSPPTSVAAWLIGHNRTTSDFWLYAY